MNENQLNQIYTEQAPKVSVEEAMQTIIKNQQTMGQDLAYLNKTNLHMQHFMEHLLHRIEVIEQKLSITPPQFVPLVIP